MYGIYIVYIALALSICLVNANDASIAVFGYLPEYRTANFDYAGAFRNGLTHLIFFSIEIDKHSYLPKALDRLPSAQEISYARAAADNHKGKLILGFGGFQRSEGFAEMTQVKSRRSKFIKSLIEILESYELDGVDFNWEYPSNPKEWKNWGLLLNEVKASLGSRNFVSFTMYNMEQMFDLINGYGLLEHADFVHCMAYDNKGKHSTIEFAQMGIFLSKKLGKYQSKWTLGIPFYGRNIKTGEAKAFYELIPDLSDNRTDTVNEVYYNSQETIVSKIIMARIAKIGGIMIWELGQDIRPYISISDGESSQTSLNENSLMNAIYKGIRIDLDSLLSSNSKDL